MTGSDAHHHSIPAVERHRATDLGVAVRRVDVGHAAAGAPDESESKALWLDLEREPEAPYETGDHLRRHCALATWQHGALAAISGAAG